MAFNSKHSLQSPDQFGLGNDYEQDMSYVVSAKDGKSTYRDGIFTQLAQDVKDPEGFNKRTVVVPQSAWKEAVPEEWQAKLSGETDGLEVFSDLYAAGQSFGRPFADTPAEYYGKDIADKVPTGIDVADFRQTKDTSAEEE